VVGRQPNAPAAFTPGEIPGTHFQRLSRLQGTWRRQFHCESEKWGAAFQSREPLHYLQPFTRTESQWEATETVRNIMHEIQGRHLLPVKKLIKSENKNGCAIHCLGKAPSRHPVYQ